MKSIQPFPPLHIGTGDRGVTGDASAPEADAPRSGCETSRSATVAPGSTESAADPADETPTTPTVDLLSRTPWSDAVRTEAAHDAASRPDAPFSDASLLHTPTDAPIPPHDSAAATPPPTYSGGSSAASPARAEEKFLENSAPTRPGNRPETFSVRAPETNTTGHSAPTGTPCPPADPDAADIGDDAAPDCTGHEVHGPAVERARALLPDPAELERTSALFRALGEPSRAAMLLALHPGELCVCDLAEVLGSSVSSVSHHLRLLRAERLVRCRRDGKNAFYRLDDDHVRTLLAQALEHVRHDEGPLPPRSA